MALNERQLKLQEDMAAAAGLSVPEWRKRIAEELMIKQARANGIPDWALDMARAVPTDMIRDIALRDKRAPAGPSSAGIIPSSQQMSNVRGTGGPVGWQHEIPLGPPPGVNYADRLMDVQDQRDRLELLEREARRQALLKAAESKR